MSNIHEKENELFARWRTNRTEFIPDGVADEQSYLSSQRKIVFVLKEPNSKKSDWDLRDFLRSGNKSQTYDNVARWVIGIRKINRDLNWKEIEKLNKEKRVEALETICAINLKKSIGGYTTKNDELETTAHEDADFINEQFALYEADLVICCGSVTTKIFNNRIRLPLKSKKWRATKRGIWYCEYENNKFVIRYSHPAARVEDCLLYYGLVDAIREMTRS